MCSIFCISKCIVRKKALKKKSSIAKGYAEETRKTSMALTLPQLHFYSMMMKSSTFFFPFLSRLDPFYPSPLNVYIIPVSV